MKFGDELIKSLEDEITRYRESISDRLDRIQAGLTDMDDCFMSQRCEERGMRLAEDKIKLIRDGGLHWFREYATLDGTPVRAKWCHTRYGSRLKAEMPDGSVVWTSSCTKAGLAKKGLKLIECLRPAWYSFQSPHGGLLGAYTGSYELFPSDYNYATGEPAGEAPVDIRDLH